MDGQPGDKSPGYYRVSLRDEVKTGFQMPKLQGPSGTSGHGLGGSAARLGTEITASLFCART
jgi:hypothetical protein